MITVKKLRATSLYLISGSVTKLNFRICYFSIRTILNSHPHKIRESHGRMLINFPFPAPVLACILSTDQHKI